MDADGYPDEQEITRIVEWPLPDWTGLLDFVRERWQYADWGWTQEGKIYSVSTGGWSGNEEIIGALQRNQMFWIMCWESSAKGGHFVFEIPQS